MGRHSRLREQQAQKPGEWSGPRVSVEGRLTTTYEHVISKSK